MIIDQYILVPIEVDKNAWSDIQERLNSSDAWERKSIATAQEEAPCYRLMSAPTRQQKGDVTCDLVFVEPSGICVLYREPKKIPNNKFTGRPETGWAVEVAEHRRTHLKDIKGGIRHPVVSECLDAAGITYDRPDVRPSEATHRQGDSRQDGHYVQPGSTVYGFGFYVIRPEGLDLRDNNDASLRDDLRLILRLPTDSGAPSREDWIARDEDQSSASWLYTTWSASVAVVLPCSQDSQSQSASAATDLERVDNILLSSQLTLQSIWNRCHVTTARIAQELNKVVDDDRWDRRFTRRHKSRIRDTASLVRIQQQVSQALSPAVSARQRHIFNKLAESSRVQDELLALTNGLNALEKAVDLIVERERQQRSQRGQRFLAVLFGMFTAISAAQAVLTPQNGSVGPILGLAGATGLATAGLAMWLTSDRFGTGHFRSWWRQCGLNGWIVHRRVPQTWWQDGGPEHWLEEFKRRHNSTNMKNDNC